MPVVLCKKVCSGASLSDGNTDKMWSSHIRRGNSSPSQNSQGWYCNEKGLQKIYIVGKNRIDNKYLPVAKTC